MSYYLGVDVGTTKIAVAVIDSVCGQVIAANEVLNGSEITSAADKARGRSEWDAERAAKSTFDCIAGALVGIATDQIKGIGVTGQMHGMVLVDAAGQAVSPFIGWQDQRCQEIVPGTNATYIARMMQLAGLGGFARTGCTPATGYLASTLFWLAVNGDPRVTRAPAGAQDRVVACFLPDFIVLRLTGEGPTTDPSNAGGSGVFNVATGQWNQRLIERLGLRPDLFPPIAKSGMIAGELTAAVAECLGLRPGIPVTVGCGDNQASFAGSVSDPGNAVLVNVGTGAQVSAWVSNYVAVQTVDTRPYLDGRYLLVGAPLCGGRSYALLRDFFGRTGMEFYGAQGEEDVYEHMTHLAKEVPPGADGLKCEPLFTGTRLDPDRRASFVGISQTNFTPGHFARAVLEGIAEQLRQHYADMLECGVKPRQILVSSGNGVRRNPLLADILCRAFDMPLCLTANIEEAAYGAALMAAVGVGEFNSPEEASKLVQYVERLPL